MESLYKTIEIHGTPFDIELSWASPSGRIYIDLDDIIDPYDYHDAPSSVSVPLNIDMANEIIKALEQYIKLVEGDK